MQEEVCVVMLPETPCQEKIKHVLGHFKQQKPWEKGNTHNC